MDEEVRMTLEFIEVILRRLGCTTPSTLIDKFLNPSGDEKDFLSNSDLNVRLADYIDDFLPLDVCNGARMIRLGNQYLPLGVISKWKTDEKYSYSKNEQEFRIILNETEGKTTRFDNIVAVYENESQREADIEKLIEMKLSDSVKKR